MWTSKRAKCPVIGKRCQSKKKVSYGQTDILQDMNVFRYAKEARSRETRSIVSELLYVPKSRTEYYMLSFRISTAIL